MAKIVWTESEREAVALEAAALLERNPFIAFASLIRLSQHPLNQDRRRRILVKAQVPWLDGLINRIHEGVEVKRPIPEPEPEPTVAPAPKPKYPLSDDEAKVVRAVVGSSLGAIERVLSTMPKEPVDVDEDIDTRLKRLVAGRPFLYFQKEAS